MLPHESSSITNATEMKLCPSSWPRAAMRDARWTGAALADLLDSEGRRGRPGQDEKLPSGHKRYRESATGDFIRSGGVLKGCTKGGRPVPDDVRSVLKQTARAVAGAS